MTAHSSPQVKVNGKWLSSLAIWGDLKLTRRWPYGCWEATWQMALKPYQRIPNALVAAAQVEVRLGTAVIWAGDLAEPNWDTGEMIAVGAVRQGETSLCLTGAGETTSVPDAVIDQAIARGALTWTRRTSLSGAPFATADTTAQLNYVTALMDAWSNSTGQRWGVDAHREVYAAPDPTVPTIYARPGSGVLGVTEESLAASVFGRYQGNDGAYRTVSVGAGRPEVGVSLLGYGPIDAGTATSVITGIRAQLQARTGWTNGLTLTADMVTTPGGQRMALQHVQASKMARLLGLRDESGATASTDVVIGESIWDISAGTVQMNPVGLSDRSLSGVVEAAGGQLL